MKRLLKWGGVLLGSVLGIVLVAAASVFYASQSRINQSYDLTPSAVVLSVAVPPSQGNAEGIHDESGSGALSDGATFASYDEAVAWGEHIAVTRGCGDCHGEDLGGATFAEAMPVFKLYGSNLTSGGVGATYTDIDWVRAIRHGVGPDGKPLLLMPSYEYYYLDDDDLAALIAYLKTLDPVERDLPGNAVGPVGRVLFVSGQLPLVAAEMIDHETPTPEAPPKGATVEYGRYLAVFCTGCHGEEYSGGPIPGVPPDWPMAANITQDVETGIGAWTEGDFLRVINEGRRPDGRQIEPQYMPWPNFARFEPDELEALWMYLKTVEAKEFGGR